MKVTAIKLKMKPWVLEKSTLQTLSSMYNFSFLIVLIFLDSPARGTMFSFRKSAYGNNIP